MLHAGLDRPRRRLDVHLLAKKARPWTWWACPPTSTVCKAWFVASGTITAGSRFWP